jgi:hypothetical protein
MDAPGEALGVPDVLELVFALPDAKAAATDLDNTLLPKGSLHFEQD